LVLMLDHGTKLATRSGRSSSLGGRFWRRTAGEAPDRLKGPPWVSVGSPDRGSPDSRAEIIEVDHIGAACRLLAVDRGAAYRERDCPGSHRDDLTGRWAKAHARRCWQPAKPEQPPELCGHRAAEIGSRRPAAGQVSTGRVAVKRHTPIVCLMHFERDNTACQT
jgi:hypothetical protein